MSVLISDRKGHTDSHREKKAMWRAKCHHRQRHTEGTRSWQQQAVVPHRLFWGVTVPATPWSRSPSLQNWESTSVRCSNPSALCWCVWCSWDTNASISNLEQCFHSVQIIKRCFIGWRSFGGPVLKEFDSNRKHIIVSTLEWPFQSRNNNMSAKVDTFKTWSII